ncbi:MAG: mechanosensitive ion channel family protein [Candidatus Bathyarchaeota archaeon]|nr:mechanosensitive ion channel family protein [Candidatus Bathyarchaeota archaeon]
MADLVQFLDFNFTAWIPELVQITLILILGLIINRVIIRSVASLQQRENADRRAIRQIGLIARYIIFFLVTLSTFSVAGLTPNVLLTSLGIAGIAAGFAAQDLLSNILNGIFLIFENTINVNDVVKIGDTYGIVRLVKLRSTEIRTFDNNIVNIPNSLLAKSNVVNMTSGSRYSMTTITVKLAYEADYDAVMVMMRDIVSRSEGVIVNALHGIKFEITNIGERYHGLNLIVYFFVDAQNEPWIRTTVHKDIVEKLVEENVPFHRDSPK